MRIVCPACDTAYAIPDGKIGDAGRDVRCSRCGTRWRAEPVAEAPLPLPPVREDVVDDEAFAGASGNSQSAIDDLFSFGGDDDGLDATDDESEGEAEEAEETYRPSMPVMTAPDAKPHPSADAPMPGYPPLRKDIESSARPKVHVTPRTTPSILMLLKKKLRDLRGVAFRSRMTIGLTVFALAFLLPAAGIVFRTTIVGYQPKIASLYNELGLPVNLTGLEFRQLNTLRELENGQPVLVVEGAIANITEAPLAVPTVRMALRGAEGQEIYAWSVDPKSSSVPAGHEIRFRTRLASPPEEAVDVQLRFTERKTRQAVLP